MNFACKKIELEELVKCSFDLNKTEYKVMTFLLRAGGKHTVASISKKMGLERTTVQKALKGLMDKKLAKRVQRNLSRGGYLFLYEIDEKENIKKRQKEIVYNWYKSVEKEIDNW
jgi:predicted transcriptional regulator